MQKRARETSWLESRAADTPHAPALRLPGRRQLSFAQLADEAAVVASGLAQAGVAPGDVVATLLGSADFASVVHGIWRCGATVLPVNPRLTEPEVTFQLGDAGVRFLAHGPAELADRAGALALQVPFLTGLTGLTTRSAKRSALPDGAPPAAPTLPERPLAILYTSGTTGRPKGAVLTAANFLASARASQQHLGSRAGDRCLACMPLFHVGGLSILVRSLLAGSCVQVQEGFDPGAVARALEDDEITDVSFVANMLARVIAARGDAKAPASLRNVLVGGGPVPEPLLQQARSLGYPVAPTYGLTEATSQVATRAPDDDSAQGLRPLPGVELRVGPDGEICVRGEIVMSGYLGRPDETAKTLRDGWLHTGDLGQLHADGTLTVLDRRRDLIVSGGENIYPAELETVLLAHPQVAEVGIGRRSDARYGARPVAWFVPAPETPAPTPDELLAFCRSRLAAFKLPVAFHRVEALPRTAAGKLKRFLLVEPGS